MEMYVILLLIIIIVVILSFQSMIMHYHINQQNYQQNYQQNNRQINQQHNQQTKSELQNPTPNPTPTPTQNQNPTSISQINIPATALTTTVRDIDLYGNQNTPIISQPRDIIREYDYRKLYDPLENPVRRIDRYSIPPVYFKRLIDIPSRGYPDNFTQIGILIKKGDSHKKDDNKILRLFGRQEYPGSYGYEYYTALNSGFDSIKIPLDVRRGKELYTGDDVFIRETGGKYEVSLHKYDAPRYYPDLLF